MSDTGNEISVSIVIPAYNREKYVGNTIKSALAQTLPPDEVIVVDDGSTDRTAEIVSGFGAPVRLIQIENTGVGPSRPRNVGVAAARSRYIVLLDSDDVLLPEFLATTVSLLSREPALGLVFCRSMVADRTQAGESVRTPRRCHDLLDACPMRELQPGAYVISARDAFATFCKGNFIGTATANAIPKRVWDEVGGYDDSGDLPTSNDMDFIFKIVNKYDVGYLSTPLAVYYRHLDNISNANLSGTFKEHTYLNHLKVLRRQWKPSLKRSDRCALRRRIGDGLRDLGYGYRRTGEYTKALKSYAASLSWSFRFGAVAGILKLPVARALRLDSSPPRVTHCTEAPPGDL
jgi:glycosyltransferase involved in cell wall biosynthesis